MDHNNKHTKEELTYMQQKFAASIPGCVDEMKQICKQLGQTNGLCSEKSINQLSKILHQFIRSSGSNRFYNHSRLASKAKSFADQFLESPENTELLNRLQECLLSLATLPIEIVNIKLDMFEDLYKHSNQI